MLTILLLICIHVAVLHRAQAEEKFEWQTATPESQGMSARKLDLLRDELAERQTRVFLVIRNDKIVYEWYGKGQSADMKQGTASLAKAVVGGMSLAVALSDGRLTLDDEVAQHVPQWKGDARKAKITVRQLGSHTSGLEDAEASSSGGKSIAHENLTGWKGDFWKRLDPPNDPFSIARDKSAVKFEPGKGLDYSNTAIAMLTYVITAAYRDRPQSDVRTLLRDRIMRPIGAADDEWSIGYDKTFTVDGLPLVAAWGGGAIVPRALARIGRLVVREGDWDGRALLSKEAVRQVTTDAGLPGHCGMGWWTNGGGRYGDLPRDAVWGAGAGDQILLVIPSLKLIMVRNGAALRTPSELHDDDDADVFMRYHDWRTKHLFVPLVKTINDEQAAATSRRPAVAPLEVQQDEHQIAVISAAVPSWKAVIDRRKGGVMTDFRVPATGENLASADGGRFEGLCNLVYVDFKETGKESGYVAKGTFSRFGTITRFSIEEQTTERVVVVVEGTAGNQVEPKVDVVKYSQRYTLLPESIVCAGELQWLFDGVVAGSHPQLIQPELKFARDAVQGEMRVWDRDTGPLPLAQTNSKGSNYPRGIEYPLTVEIPLRGGHALRVSSRKLPEAFREARFYYNEYPHQIDFQRGFAFKVWEGWPGNGAAKFASGEPVRYAYELAVASPLPPPSPVISQLDWAPAATIVRRARGSDNWPLTWADDGNLYAAYGDGNGFEPYLEDKLSLGLAKITGGPDDFEGINLRSPGIEQRGGGAEGQKASGLLMVDGVLSLWVRNAHNSRLAQSADRGQTWTWCDWKFTTSFGCPTFLNFGANYAGARDDFVYVYSPDTNSAYEASDRMVLARAQKSRLADKDAWQFFAGVEPSGTPRWTADIAERGAVFSHRGKCYRSGITWCPGLKRYLWCQIHPESTDPRGPRFQGGFGVYDAPEPWGPWTTVYYTDDWDVGPGDTSSFPTKWMSADGRTLHLVFSGDDHFSVRRARLTVNDAR